MRLPNLLDSRVPDGDGEEDNVVMAEWGQEYIKNGEVRVHAQEAHISIERCLSSLNSAGANIK